MNRFVEKLVQRAARLAFWRKPVEANPAQEPPADSSHAVAEAPPSQDAGAAADAASPPKASLLARLTSLLRRQPKPDPLVADEAAEQPGAARPDAEADKGSTATRDAHPADDADAIPVSRLGRVLGMLSNKWVWIPGASIAMLAVIATMTLMLLQSKHDNEQLQADLVATRKALKKTGIEQPAAAHQNPMHMASLQAGDPVPAPDGHVAPVSEETASQAGEPVDAAAGSADSARPGGYTGNCDVSDQASVIKNLRNCIEGFNKATRR